MKYVKLMTLIGLITLNIKSVAAVEILGEVGLENRHFNQRTEGYDSKESPSLFLKVSFYEQSNIGENLFAFTPFIRLDKNDNERTHFDIKELSWLHIDNHWEYRTGIRIENWGVTEAINLVDIINQKDDIDQIDGDEKLGQPMINLSRVSDYGIFDIYALVGLREKKFPSAMGRPRLPLLVNTDNAKYESSAQNKRIDFAFRWQHLLGNWQIALSKFIVTPREPVLTLATDSFDLNNFLTEGKLRSNDNPTLFPFYPVIDQTGIEALYLKGNWGYKAELITQSGGRKTFYAADIGLEYNANSIFTTNIDISWILEYLYDSREGSQSSIYQDDLYLASRIAFNNQASTEALLSVTYDSKSKEKIIGMESSWRHSNNIKIQFDGFIIDAGKPISPETFINAGLKNQSLVKQAALYARQNFIQVTFSYHF